MNCAAQGAATSSFSYLIIIDEDVRIQARSFGVIPPLLEMLSLRSNVARGRAIATLFNLCLHGMFVLFS